MDSLMDFLKEKVTGLEKEKLTDSLMDSRMHLDLEKLI